MPVKWSYLPYRTGGHTELGEGRVREKGESIKNLTPTFTCCRTTLRSYTNRKALFGEGGRPTKWRSKGNPIKTLGFTNLKSRSRREFQVGRGEQRPRQKPHSQKKGISWET